jgi:hypothetical protein
MLPGFYAVATLIWRGARKEALACVRDGGIWSPLAPPGSR